MAYIKQITFEDFLEKIKYQQLWRCIKRKGDLFIVCCGGEGVGKSLLIIALSVFLDKNYSIERIFYEWDTYKKRLKDALRSKMAVSYSRKKLEKYNVGLDLDNFLEFKGENLEPGSVLHYDEAGQGASNRESMVNIEQYKALQTMRHLRCVNIWIAPKLRVLDVYAREERVKFFIWVDDVGTLEEPDRRGWLWSRVSMSRIFSTHYWWTLFYDTNVLLRRCPPDYSFPIPNLETEKHIPAELIESYEIRKCLYDALRMEREDTGKTKKVRVMVDGDDVYAHARRYKVSLGTAKNDFLIYGK